MAILSVENVTLERGGKHYPLGFSSTPPASLSNVMQLSPQHYPISTYAAWADPWPTLIEKFDDDPD